MICQEIPLNLSDPGIFLSAYPMDEATTSSGTLHPAILILAGEAEKQEAEALAVQFTQAGYNAFILRSPAAATHLAGATALACIRARAGEWRVDPQGIILCGLSSGARLAVDLLTRWKDAEVLGATGLSAARLRPNAGLLIQSNSPPAGEEPPAARSALQLVDEDTPPVFVWWERSAGSGPPGEAMALVSVMLAHGCQVDLHLLASGSPAKEAAQIRPGMSKEAPLHDCIEQALHWLSQVLPDSQSVPASSQRLELERVEKDVKPAQYYRNIFNDREGMFRHSPFSLEQDLVRHVIHGDEDAALETLTRISRQGSKAVLASDTLRSAKNSMICSCTFLTRAAIQAGVSDEEAFALSDASIQNIETLGDERTVLNYETTLLLQFIRLVKQRQGRNYSTAVRKALHYLASNLDKPFHLASVADAAGVHPNYLSRRFKQETGSTLSNYAITRKVHEATYFVQHTDYRMAEIAALYGFSSQSHFSAVFKKVLLISPGDYRNRSKFA